MTTTFLYLLILIYLLYYAGNIVYDVFLKKEPLLPIDGNQEFSLADYEEENRNEITNVGIEEVENLNTPKSFTKNYFDREADFSEERDDINLWRTRFESEQNIDAFQAGVALGPPSAEGPEVLTGKGTDQESGRKLSGERFQNEQVLQKKLNDERWFNMLNAAETNVQLISNKNGHKVYQSVAM